MSNAATAKVLFLVAAVLGTPYAGNQVLNPPAVERPVVESPKTAAIGELVTLRHPGDRVEWLLETEDYVVVSPGTIAVSFREAGEHEVVVSALVGGKLVIDKISVSVGGEAPAPDKAPDVSPDEAPDVEADDIPEIEIAAKSELAEKVHNWCEAADVDKEVAHELYQNFTKAASESKRTSGLVANTARYNVDLHKDGAGIVLGKIQLYILQHLSGKGFEEHRCAWDEIAQGFLAWSN